jgi:hypothetical protein
MKIQLYLAVLLMGGTTAAAQTTKHVNHFDKVIISPHVEVTFVPGNEEKVTIEKSTVKSDKVIIEVDNHTFRIYLYALPAPKTAVAIRSS